MWRCRCRIRSRLWRWRTIVAATLLTIITVCLLMTRSPSSALLSPPSNNVNPVWRSGRRPNLQLREEEHPPHSAEVDQGAMPPTQTKTHHLPSNYTHPPPNKPLPPNALQTNKPLPPTNYSHPANKQPPPSTQAHLNFSLTSKPLPPAVLDPEGITILPQRATVPEGHSLQLTCLSRHQERQHAPHLTFELPSMSQALERNILVRLIPGSAVLKFPKVHRGHAGMYKCIATDAEGNRRYNWITVGVIRTAREEPADYGGVSDKADAILAGIAGGDQDWLEELQQAKRDMMAGGGGDGDDRELLTQKLESLRERLKHSSPHPVDMEQLLHRGKFQQEQVEKFCRKYNLSEVAGQLPATNSTRGSLYRHLLINDKSHTLFCFAPKTGCTNLRVLFFITLGYIPLSQFLQSRDGVDQDRLEAAQFTESFFSRTDNHRRYALRHYFKFVMYRNPLERLVSGYRSKVQRYPLIGFKEHKPHFNWLRKAILLFTQPEQYRTFIQQHGKVPINITFPDFIEYWLRQDPELKYDEHFRSISSLCQPCTARYDFYGNFKNFETDSRVLVDKIRSRPEYIRAGYYTSGHDTESLAPALYSQLTLHQKERVLALLAQELDFFYHIFPEERNSHKSILNLNSDLS